MTADEIGFLAIMGLTEFGVVYALKQELDRRRASNWGRKMARKRWAKWVTGYGGTRWRVR